MTLHGPGDDVQLRLLSVADVAERCGVSVDAVRRAIRRGDLAASKVFGRVRVDERDLAAYIDNNWVGGPPVRQRRLSRPRGELREGSLQEINRAMKQERKPGRTG